MKKLLLFFVISIMLVGCSNNKQTTDASPLEEQIKNALEENNMSPNTVVYYDIKDDFIYTVVLEQDGLQIAVLKNNNGNIEWLGGGNGTNVISEGGSDYFTLITPNNQVPEIEEVNEVRVFGKPAKLQYYFERVTDDLNREVKYWISISKKEPAHSDFEFIVK